MEKGRPGLTKVKGGTRMEWKLNLSVKRKPSGGHTPLGQGATGEGGGGGRRQKSPRCSMSLNSSPRLPLERGNSNIRPVHGGGRREEAGGAFTYPERRKAWESPSG